MAPVTDEWIADGCAMVRRLLEAGEAAHAATVARWIELHAPRFEVAHA